MAKSVAERMAEFCIYHRDGDGECNAILLKKYADAHGLTAKQRFDLAYFFSVTYCCESGIILFDNRKAILNGFYPNKGDMIFQSDRKYVKMRDYYTKLLDAWRNGLCFFDPARWYMDGLLNLGIAVKEVESWYMFGRFSAFLFLETYATLMGGTVTAISIDWKNGDTATSGLLNLFGNDKEADIFDSKGVLLVDADIMDIRLAKTIREVIKTGGDPNTTKIETSLCAYRKFYKGTRYNGFYLDRMLEELYWYAKEKPKYKALTDELFRIRSEAFPDEFLGERHGWNGIRKENKKFYQLYGII